MDLSLHYSGNFNPSTSLPVMIEEVKDIAEVFKWKYFVFEEEFPANSIGKTEYNQDIYGICFSPPNSEPIDLCFLSNGRMSSIINLNLYGNSKNKEKAEFLYMLSTKTQYGGVEIHKLIIHLLKYLSGKYLQNFSFVDEGQYWETGDEELLQKIFKRYTELINNFASSFENFPIKQGETFEEYFERLMKHIHKNLRKNVYAN